MKLCVCKNITVEQFKSESKNGSFEETKLKLQLGSMCKTCINQAQKVYKEVKENEITVSVSDNPKSDI